MGTTPSTDNVFADLVDGFVRAAILGGETAAEDYIKVQVPILEAPVIGLFTNAIIKAIAGSIYTQATDLVAKVVIDIQTNLEKSAVATAVNNLKQAQGTGDTNAINQASDAYDQAAASLIHWDGSSNPPAL